MYLPTFADLEYQGKKRKTRRELFLKRMDALIPWQSLEDRVRPVYPKAGLGRHPNALTAMLRVHCVQLLYNPLGKLRTSSATPARRTPVFTGAGSALRVRSSQAVRGTETLGAPARRDHHPQFSSSLGKTRPGPGSFGGNRRSAGGAGTEVSGGNHRGRQHHRGTVIDQEPCQGTGPGNAPDQEGEPVAFRYESAYRGGL